MADVQSDYCCVLSRSHSPGFLPHLAALVHDLVTVVLVVIVVVVVIAVAVSVAVVVDLAAVVSIYR